MDWSLDVRTAAHNVRYTLPGVDPGTIETKRTRAAEMRYDLQMVLPEGVSALDDPLGALLAGATLVGSWATTEGSQRGEVMAPDGRSLQASVQTHDYQAAALSLGRSGLTFEGINEGASSRVRGPGSWPPHLGIDYDRAAVALHLPLAPGEDPQRAGLQVDVEALEFSRGIWDMIDPDVTINRDPGNLHLDMQAEATLHPGFRLSDLTSPVQEGTTWSVDRVTLTDLAADMAGVTLSATGDLSADWTDFQGWPGLPALSGGLTAEATGIDTLLDRLDAAGVVPPDLRAAARAALPLVAQPNGPDRRTMTVEARPDGQILVNGRRLR